MARYREKPVTPLVQELFEKFDCDSLSELHKKRDIDFDFLRSIANGRKSTVLLAHYVAAKKAGMTLDEWAAKLLA